MTNSDSTYLNGPQNHIERRERIYASVVTLTPVLAFLYAIYQVTQTGFQLHYLILFLPLYILGEIGAEVGHHRYFSHRAFEASRPLKIFLIILASISGKGSIFEFAAVHRRHHLFADVDGDPHSPHIYKGGFTNRLRSFYHSYYGWITTIRMSPAEHARVLDLIKDKDILSLGNKRMYYVLLVAGIILPGCFGFLMLGTLKGFFDGMIWGGGVRLFFQQQTAFAINSVCHLWGQKPFKTTDESRNNTILAYLTLGVGWHNNHHAFPSTATNQFTWWQLDLCGWFIKSMKVLGLASNLKIPTAEQIKARRQNL